MYNPYLEEFNKILSKKSNRKMALLAQQVGVSAEMAAGMCREELVDQYGWAIPDQKAIEIIAKYAPIIEIGAGMGYWAYLLKQLNIDVLAYDSAPLDEPCWTKVLQGDESLVKDHPHRSLFLCWPPYDEPMAADCLRNYAGNVVIYVGEWCGCTADEDFHNMLTDKFVLTQNYKIPRFQGIRDCLFVYQRRT